MDRQQHANELTQALVALRKAGAARLDPVGMHYLETLDKRLQGLHGDVHKVVQHKLTQALAEFSARFEQAPSGARTRSAKAATPPAVAGGALAELVAQLPSQPATSNALRSLRQSLSQLSVAQHISEALDQAPQNAGPINSHHLMLRSLELMRELSPAYLQHFMTYADTLLFLEQSGVKKPSTSKPRKAQT